MNYKAIIGAAIAAVIAGLTAWQASGSVTTAIASACVPLAVLFPTSAVLPPGEKVPVVGPPTAVFVALGLGLVAFAPACGPVDWRDASLRSADGLRVGGKLVSSLLEAASRTQLDKCEAANGKPSPKCRPLVEKIKKRLRIWHDGVRPAERVTVGALVRLYREVETAAAAGGGNKNGVFGGAGFGQILADIIKAITEAIKVARDSPAEIEARLVKYLSAPAVDKTDALRAEILARYPDDNQ